eukprot:CAMPEP_0185035658 /NCGR_PEP_ID=MMETSP1103-20130426/27437_1 /TAXON_ID=36769 /ORGANISM="Paraphysomonas bandaiensis, Strain Caron Lab Isolate" /LENGTH=199 /DNA_ID=CAMNT_0027572849 /DNA_START=170 /DNA_END=766 /DNA_ORIENTATION=-
MGCGSSSAASLDAIPVSLGDTAEVESKITDTTYDNQETRRNDQQHSKKSLSSSSPDKTDSGPRGSLVKRLSERHSVESSGQRESFARRMSSRRASSTESIHEKENNPRKSLVRRLSSKRPSLASLFGLPVDESPPPSPLLSLLQKPTTSVYIYRYLSMCDLSRLDVAHTSHTIRKEFLNTFQGVILYPTNPITSSYVAW